MCQIHWGHRGKCHVLILYFHRTFSLGKTKLYEQLHMHELITIMVNDKKEGIEWYVGIYRETLTYETLIEIMYF